MVSRSAWSYTFSYNVHDLSNCIEDCVVIQYADDTQLVHTGTVNNIQDLLRCETSLLKVKEYFHVNGLMLNTAKTQCIFIGTRGHTTQIPNNTVIKVDDANIAPSTSVKNLGVFFDNYMQFDSHITHICKKNVGIIMYNVNRIKEHFSKQARIMVLQSLM